MPCRRCGSGGTTYHVLSSEDEVESACPLPANARMDGKPGRTEKRRIEVCTSTGVSVLKSS